MKVRPSLFALFAFLVLPALALAGEVSAPPAAPIAVTPETPVASPLPALAVAPLATSECAAASPIALAFSPIDTGFMCNGVDYPGCFPGGSCQDKCCYCECRADGGGAGICSFECCLGH